MNIADWSIRNKTTTLVVTALLLVGGIMAFQGLARLEDPEFTIKEALVITPYPGATAAQVEQEISDKIEIAVQQLGQLKEVESKSDRGLSTVTVRIKDKLPQKRPSSSLGRAAAQGRRHPAEPAAGRRPVDRQRRLWRRVGYLHRNLRCRLQLRRAEGGRQIASARALTGERRGEDRAMGRA